MQQSIVEPPPATAASAHVIFVTPPGEGAEPKVGWTGSPIDGESGQGLPEAASNALGKGLVAGGPTGEAIMSPSHVKGLNVACEAQEANPSAADIRGPAAGDPSTWGCPHGE